MFSNVAQTSARNNQPTGLPDLLSRPAGTGGSACNDTDHSSYTTRERSDGLVRLESGSVKSSVDP